MSIKSDLTSGHPARVTSAMCAMADRLDRQERRIAALEAELEGLRGAHGEPSGRGLRDGEGRPRSAILDALAKS